MTMMINSYGVNPGDPYWSQVTLLMGFDGSIVDERAGLTVSNPAVLQATTVSSPAQPYGSAWLQLIAGNFQYLSIAETANQFWLQGDFTLEFTTQVVTFDPSVQRMVFSQYNNTNGQRSFYVYVDGNSSLNKFGLVVSSDGINTTAIGAITADDAGVALTTGVTYRLCIERAGNTWRFYVNGKTITTATSSISVFNSSEPLLVGAHYLSGVGQYFDGYMDEVRLTNGRARYQGDYTPAVSKFPRH